MCNTAMGSSKGNSFNEYLNNAQNNTVSILYNINWSQREHMHVQPLRLLTFQNWSGPPSATRLASAGFYYDEEQGKVICFSCNGLFHDWDRDLSITEQHRRAYPNCAFANNLDSRNIPFDSNSESRLQTSQSEVADNREENSLIQRVPQRSPYNTTTSSRDSGTGSSLSSSSSKCSQRSSSLSSKSSSNASSSSGSRKNINETIVEESYSCTSNLYSSQSPHSLDNRPASKDGKASNTMSAESLKAKLPASQSKLRLECGMTAADFCVEKHRLKEGFRNGMALSSANSSAEDANSMGMDEVDSALVPVTGRALSSSTEGQSQRLMMNNHRALTNEVLHKHASLAVLDQSWYNPRVVEPDHGAPTISTQPRHHEFFTLVNRLATYKGWPEDKQQRPVQMALAGYFYAGMSDCVRCFFCNGGLRNWLPGDDPWEEHIRWFPTCRYARYPEQFPQFSELSISDENGSAQPSLQSTNPGWGNQGARASLARQSRRVEADELPQRSSPVEQFMSSTVALGALDMGFSQELVRQVAENKYQADGELYSACAQLVEDIFTYQENVGTTETTPNIIETPAPLHQVGAEAVKKQVPEELRMMEVRAPAFACAPRPNPLREEQAACLPVNGARSRPKSEASAAPPKKKKVPTATLR